MEKLLESLGLSSISSVGISVSTSNMIEMISIDKSKRTITKYACTELKYNNAIREIINYEDFVTAVQELFKELNINPKNCNVVLNIPNVHFAFTSLPLILPEEQTATAIASEVEESYLFKRHEPVISWNTININKETEKRYIVYGAVQENAIQNLKDIFEDLGAKLVAIETSNSSMIKGIVYSLVLEEEFAKNETTNILLIGSNSYSIFCMQGKKLVDYFEEPLAIKSFSSDEVYDAISSAAGSALENYPSKNLLVVSETNDVSAEILCHKIQFEGNLKYLDRNMYADKSFMELSASILPKYSPMISLEAVGAAAYSFETFPIRFNFLSSDMELSSTIIFTFMGNDYEIERKSITNIGLIVGVVVLCILLLISFIISMLDKKMVSEINSMQDEFSECQRQINSTNIGGDANNIYNVSRTITEENEKQIAVIFGLGTEIPEDVYLTSFYSNSNAEVRIEGNSNSSESIYEFIKGLKTKYPDIKISKLQLGYLDESAKATVYSFTMESEAAARRAAEQAAQQQNNDNNAGDNQQDNNNQGNDNPAPPPPPPPGNDLPAPAAP